MLGPLWGQVFNISQKERKKKVERFSDLTGVGTGDYSDHYEGVIIAAV